MSRSLTTQHNNTTNQYYVPFRPPPTFRLRVVSRAPAPTPVTLRSLSTQDTTYLTQPRIDAVPCSRPPLSLSLSIQARTQTPHPSLDTTYTYSTGCTQKTPHHPTVFIIRLTTSRVPLASLSLHVNHPHPPPLSHPYAFTSPSPLSPPLTPPPRPTPPRSP